MLHSINVDQINSVCTKFFYKEDTLCYKLVVSLTDGELLTEEFSSYEAYKAVHEDIVSRVNVAVLAA